MDVRRERALGCCFWVPGLTALAEDGALWVADCGNRRLVRLREGAEPELLGGGWPSVIDVIAVGGAGDL